jgi:DNA-binding cell septation regulator SpoVG
MNTKLRVDIRLFGNDEDLKAYADITLRVKFGEITIRRFKVLWDEEKQKPWVAFPQVQYYQGFSAKYFPLLNTNKRVESYIKNQILKAYRDAFNKSSKK